MRRKSRIRIVIFILTITVGILALSQANSESAYNAAVRKFPSAPPAGTYFDHLVFIILENAGMSNICGSGNNPPPCNGPDNPYMSSLANGYGLATQYVDLTGTSQPNYIGIMAATLNGCTSSCGPGTLTETNLVDRFDAAGLGWKAYMENQTPVAGCDNSDHGFYEIAHNPFVAFHDIDTNSTRCNRIVLANPANNSTCTGTDCALTKDLNSGSAPNFLWVTPNDCNNAHGASGCANGCTTSYTSACEKAADNYLSGLVPNILNSNTFKNTRSALFITFDEGSGFCPLNGSGEDCMYTVWAGPTTKTSFSSSTLDNHYSFTKTIETNWNLATMTSNDAGATAMTEFFSTQSPDFTISASPSSLAFPFGNSANSTITLNSLGGFAGPVTLTKSSTPTGLTLTLNPSSVTLIAGGTGTSTLAVSSSTIGNYTTTITGTTTGHSHNTTLNIRVTPKPNFALSVNPTSLTLTHTLSGVASPVSISPTGDPTVFESSYLANSFYAKGLYWLFFEDSRSNCEGQAGCLTYTTSTNGSRWASPTTVPVHITDSDFSVTTNGTSIFYARYNESTYITNCGRKLLLGIGNLSSSGTVAWQSEKTVIAGAATRLYADDEIILDSNGQIWIGYLQDNHGACGGNSTDLPLVIHSAGANYNSWTGNTNLTTSNSGNWHIALVSLGNGQVYASFWIANSDVHGRLYNNGWQLDEQVSSPSTLSDVNGWLFNSGTNLYMIYFDDSSESFNFAARSSGGTWTSNRIGIGESHVGFAGYYSLPDAASYDVANNQFHLFYMNGTNHRIDEWTGSAGSWNKTTGVVSTTAAPYPDSITSFIQSNPIEVGGIFYISGSSSPFTVNFAGLSFASSSLTGSFTVTVTGQNGFTGTVTLSTVTSPSTGLAVNCSVTTITGGSGSSLCSLSSTTPGMYTVNVTGVSGSLSHSASVTVTVPAASDFSINATLPSPTNVAQSQTSTITVAALNGFTGIVSLSDTPPAGLSCGSISPNSITNSGTATVSCSATTAGNYTLTLTGTSGSLNHSTTSIFRFQNFTISATSPVAVDAAQSEISTITVTALNHFNGTVSLTDSVPSGLTCGPITPASLIGHGTATASCSANVAGNYTLTITGSNGSLSHSAVAVLRFQDFTITALSPGPVNAGQSPTSTVTVVAVNGFSGTVTFTLTHSAGLSCGSVSPTSVAGSGSAAVSCNAALAGNYTATITGTSSPLIHNSTAIFQFRDFTIAASAPVPLNAGSTSSITITITSLNHFAGTVSLTDTVPSGLTCGSITPSSLTGSGTATISCSATIAGNYTLTLTGANNSLVHSTAALFQFRDFNSSASSSAAVNAGTSAISTITVSAVNHFNGPVNLTDVIPAGLVCGTINPSSVTGSGSATVSCNSSIAGNYTLTITGTSGSLVHSATSLFQFRDFTIVASSVTVNAGTSATSTIIVSAVNRFAGTVTLSDTVPSGLVCGSISPGSTTGSSTATLSCSAVVAGNYTLAITGTSAALVHTTFPIFHVQDFGIVASSPAPLNAGSSVTTTITLSAINHFAGIINLTDTVPSGLTCGTIIPNSVTGSGSATISCSASVAGNYTLTLPGASGSLVHTATVLFQYQNFTLTASPPAPNNAGSSTSTTINIASVNHFAGIVNLTDTVPSGLTCGSITPNTVTDSGTATVSCSASPAGNYTLTVTGTSGSLVHSSTTFFQFRDFAISAVSPAPANVGMSVNSNATIVAINHFVGSVSLSDSIQSGLTCGLISPSSIAGSGIATVSCSANVAGNYTFTIIGSSGSLVHNATTILRFQDFGITASSPAALTVGESATSTATVTAINGFGGTVTFNVTPSTGLTCGSFSPASVTGSGSTTVSCSATAAGNYTATITGTSTSLVHNATATFQFRDYAVSVTVTGPTNAGASENSTITITSLNHFSGLVSLTDTVSQGLTCGNLSPSAVTGSGTASVSCHSNLAANYTLTVTGTSGSLSHSATVTISIQDYSITSNPASAKINVGSAGSSIITITPLNHFSGTISLSTSGPTGTTSSINPMRITGGSGSATLMFSANAAGNYTLTITSSNATLTHTATVNIQIVDFTVTARSSTLVMLVGATGNSTITVAGLNRFTGAVNLALTTPMGLTATITPASITSSGSSILSAASSSSGNYTMTIQATSGSLTHTITIIIQVEDYSLLGSDVNILAPIGTSTSTTLTVQSLNQYAGNLTLIDAIQPPGTVPTGGIGGGARSLFFAPPAVLPILLFNPQAFRLLPAAAQQSTLNITLPSNLPSGNYLITIVATNGTLSHQFVVTLIATDLSLTATPTSVTMRPGSNSTIVINLQSLNFFQGNVTLTVTSQTGGSTGSLSTSTVQLTFYSNINLNLTIQTPANTALGNYTITVQATSGNISHTQIIMVRVSATGFAAVLAEILSPQNRASISAITILTLLAVFATLKFRTYSFGGTRLRRKTMMESRDLQRPMPTRVVHCPSGVPILWTFSPRDRF